MLLNGCRREKWGESKKVVLLIAETDNGREAGPGAEGPDGNGTGLRCSFSRSVSFRPATILFFVHVQGNPRSMFSP